MTMDKTRTRMTTDEMGMRMTMDENKGMALRKVGSFERDQGHGVNVRYDEDNRRTADQSMEPITC